MFNRDGVRPFLDRCSSDFQGQPALPAHEVMVMPAPLAAPAVDGFPVTVDEDINVTGLAHRLQRTVDGGQTDRLPAALEQLV
jgi:hypothetical protein